MNPLQEQQEKYVLYSWSAQTKAKPLHIAHAKGSKFTLENGHTLLDFSSQGFNANLGHGHPKIQEALLNYAQNPRVLHPAAIDQEKAKLGKNLSRISPNSAHTGLVKSFFCLGGADAVENAIKIARLVTKKHKVVTRYKSYHGSTLATIGYSGDSRRIPFDNTVTGVVRFPEPCTKNSSQQIDTVQLLEEIIQVEGPETIACILLESITGIGGVLIPPDSCWPRIRALCDKYHILLIADEVLTGFGRTGSWFALDHFGVTPDLMAIAKGLTGGYAPLGAVMMTQKIANYFQDEILYCGLASYGNPLSCAVANAAIHAYEEGNLIENAHIRGQELQVHLKELENSFDIISDTRSIGLLAAIELQKLSEQNRSANLQQALFDAGIFCVVRTNHIILAPPLCITQDELMHATQLLGKVLSNL